MSDLRLTPIKIVSQGAPVISDLQALVDHAADNIVCLTVNLDSKHCVPRGVCGSKVYFDTSKGTKHPESGPGGDGLTGTAFPEFDSWSVFCFEVVRYTARVVLVKENK
jgi:hypothetical protein